MITSNPVPNDVIEWTRQQAELCDSAFMGKGSWMDERYIHMSNMEQATINIQTRWNTPVGLYAYPFTEKIFHKLINADLPYLNNATWIHFIRLKTHKGVYRTREFDDGWTDGMKGRAISALIDTPERAQKIIRLIMGRVSLPYLRKEVEISPLAEALYSSDGALISLESLSPIIVQMRQILFDSFDVMEDIISSEYANEHIIYERDFRRLNLIRERTSDILHPLEIGDVPAASAINAFMTLFYIINIIEHVNWDVISFEQCSHVLELIEEQFFIEVGYESYRRDWFSATRNASLTRYHSNLYNMYSAAMANEIKPALFEYLLKACDYAEEYASVRVLSTAKYIWNITRVLADGNPRLWNILLRAAGIDAMIDDNAEGLIHPNEPFQAVFLTPAVYEVIATHRNPSRNHTVPYRKGMQKFAELMDKEAMEALYQATSQHGNIMDTSRWALSILNYLKERGIDCTTNHALTLANAFNRRYLKEHPVPPMTYGYAEE